MYFNIKTQTVEKPTRCTSLLRHWKEISIHMKREGMVMAKMMVWTEHSVQVMPTGVRMSSEEAG